MATNGGPGSIRDLQPARNAIPEYGMSRPKKGAGMARIKGERMVSVSVDEFSHDRFLETIRKWADQANRPVFVDIGDFEDLAKYCAGNYRLSRILLEARDRAILEGSESILFY